MLKRCSATIILIVSNYFRLVNAYRNVAVFSLIYVVGAQLSLFNMVSSFGVPFYKIYIRFGLGFVYDVRFNIIIDQLSIFYLD